VVRVSLICQLIIETITDTAGKRRLVSVDEKTGIQALQRTEARAPLSKGGHRRREFEYKRHGTTCLMAAFEVGKGHILTHRLHPTRTEKDFELFIRHTVELIPQEEQVILLADQLNTHISKSLVVFLAQQCGFQGDLGKKGRQGVLKNQASRRAFLEEETHRIRFVFTPKHCSWLNPVENWFAKLQRHVIENGNFSSVKELESKMVDYIKFYNRCLVKPLKWKFKGFAKASALANLNLEKLRA
jgi:hypothetical protein